MYELARAVLDALVQVDCAINNSTLENGGAKEAADRLEAYVASCTIHPLPSNPSFRYIPNRGPVDAARVFRSKGRSVSDERALLFIRSNIQLLRMVAAGTEVRCERLVRLRDFLLELHRKLIDEMEDERRRHAERRRRSEE